ncbi:MAG: AAA family ATPase [Bryobacterales bacterium]|nr:AAA family ATPase [Bryobacterales bacterium]
MYETHFHLKSNPFGMTPDPSVLFWTAAHREALAGLTYAVMRRKGFMVLTGEAGTGKTTLLRKLLDSSPVAMRTSFVYNPTLTPSEFLELALADFDIPVSINKAQRLLRLEQFLLATRREGKVAVLIIDEAHKLSPDLLEEVRLLTNFETAKEKLLQIVLAGQPELNGILNRDDLWQLKQRVAVRLQIQPLSRPDVHQYLRFRWMKAGGSEPLPFRETAVELIASWSRGIPRIINGICDNALVSAYGSNRNEVAPEDVLEVVRDLDLRAAGGVQPARKTASPPPRPMAVAIPAEPIPLAANGRSIPVTPAAHIHEQMPLERYGEREPEISLLSRWAGKFGFRMRKAEMTK